ncbi:TatD family hydrolase [Atopomonas sediminilitoris]|uniref:TatD family hydrolase n=1 Tax=Atopomonas sediminilitoris TaxID=2919919 RepID=UPI001F4E830B|nr:TatD family hydrolase [Atopomonas sediminilitoris]
MQLIDTHNHLDFPAFDHDRDAELQHARALGIVRQVLLGVTVEQWPTLWQLCQREPDLFAAFGLHPVYLNQHPSDAIEQLAAQLTLTGSHAKCCAVGEIGLDYYLPELDRNAQKTLFAAQLALAQEHQLPVLLHVRRAHADTIAMLKRMPIARGGIVHAFAGSLEEAREYQKLGFLLGIGGAATWPQAQRLRRTIAALPAEQLVLETDAPDMAPVFLAQQRNNPSALAQIAQQLAELREQPTEQFAAQCSANACRLFGWSPSHCNTP